MVTRMMDSRLIGLVSVAIWITATACASPAVSVAPTPPASPVAELCRPIELLAPSGERVDLTGTWQQADRYTYYVYQEGDCVWINGGFLTSGDSPPLSDPQFGNIGEETYVFVGHLREDFTVTGRWAHFLRGQGPGTEGPFSGTETWRLDFDADRLTLTTDERHPLEKVSGRYVAP